MCAASSWQTTAHATPARDSTAAGGPRRSRAGGGGDLGRPGAHLRGRCGRAGDRPAGSGRVVASTARPSVRSSCTRFFVRRRRSPRPIRTRSRSAGRTRGGRAPGRSEHVVKDRCDTRRPRAGGEELAEPGRSAGARAGRPAASPSLTVRRDRARHLPGDEEAPAAAEPAFLDGGHHLGNAEPARGSARAAVERAPRRRRRGDAPEGTRQAWTV